MTSSFSLGPGDPAPFEVINPGGASGVILTCEHAGKAFPRACGTLDIAPEHIETHWVYDLGAREVAWHLARLLDAPAFCGTYSRTVLDLNRGPGDPSMFVTQGEGTPIPGNLDLSPAERQARIDAIHTPYHAALAQRIVEKTEGERGPALVSIHSFTPVFHGVPRPWEVGVLWNGDARIAAPLIAFYRARGVPTGDNQPYDIRGVRGSTVTVHGDERGLANVLIEFRHDTVRTPQGAEQAADLCAQALHRIFSDPALFIRASA